MRNQARYPKNWKEIVAQVAARSGGRCECTGQCGLHRTNPGPRRCIERNGQPATWAKGRVVLTTAHLCHDESCADLSHLRHMCQRCHLRYDTKHHQKNARKTRMSRKAVADLFQEVKP
jgi:hypothetical protein